MKKLIVKEPINIRDIVSKCRFVEGYRCVHCNSTHIIKYGKYNKKQRYRCKSCNRTFNDFTNTPFHYTHYPDKWPLFIKCMLKGYSLRKSKDIIGVSYVSLFYWRHKICTSLRMLKPDKLIGIVEASDLILPLSLKGEKHLPIDISRKRGIYPYHNIDKRIYILIMLDHYQNIISSVSNVDFFSFKDINRSTKGLFHKENVLCSNYKSAYVLFSHLIHIKHHRIGNSISGGKYNIDTAKQFSKNFKFWFNNFRGVASKYLNNYLSWHRFLNKINFMAYKKNIINMIKFLSLNHINETNKSIVKNTKIVEIN